MRTGIKVGDVLSETEYDEEENVMYLKYPNVTQLW